jgi:hypothetical protein
MRTIYKYDITATRRPAIPLGSRVLSVGMQGQNLCMWIECNPAQPLYAVSVFVVGTGGTLPSEAINYVGTVQNGPLVWHVYTGAMPL